VKVFRNFYLSLLTSLFPSFSHRIQFKQALHLYHQSSVLVDFLIAKVPRFEVNSPVFFIDSHKILSQELVTLLSPYSTLTNITQDFEIIACASPAHSFNEGERVYVEETGNITFDEENTQKGLTGYVSFVDPRNRNLGTRIISVEGCIEVETFKSEDYYKMWRIMNGVCEGEKAMKSRAEHLNFQWFNGESGEESEVFTMCGMVESGRNSDNIRKR
jgi:hypothetical protein